MLPLLCLVHMLRMGCELRVALTWCKMSSCKRAVNGIRGLRFLIAVEV